VKKLAYVALNFSGSRSALPVQEQWRDQFRLTPTVTLLGLAGPLLSTALMGPMRLMYDLRVWCARRATRDEGVQAKQVRAAVRARLQRLRMCTRTASVGLVC
jgi:hypothetical protein